MLGDATPDRYRLVDIDWAAVRNALDTARSEGRVTIGDAEARTILEACGLRIPTSKLADTPERAIETATEIGYPVVLKVASPDSLHKTDVGGVKVGLHNAEDVRDAFELITYRAQRYLHRPLLVSGGRGNTERDPCSHVAGRRARAATD